MATITNRPTPCMAFGESSAVLIRRIAQGDRQALGALYDRFAGLVNGLARLVLHDPAEAEDVVQTVFIQVWRQADRYDSSRATPEAWLNSLARTRALDQLRRRTHRRETQDDQEPRPVDAPLADRIAVRAALGRLPETERRTLELAYYEDLTQREIAARLDTPLGTVRTRTRNGMIRLRKRLSSTT